MARDSSLSRLRPSAIKRPRFTTDATLPPSGGDLLGDAAVWLLRARRERPRRRRAADERDELTPLQWIKWRSIPPPARAGLQDIELARISQEVSVALSLAGWKP
jgi:hypothetical protein